MAGKNKNKKRNNKGAGQQTAAGGDQNNQSKKEAKKDEAADLIQHLISKRTKAFDELIKDYMTADGLKIEDVLKFPACKQKIGAQYVNTYDVIQNYIEASNFTMSWVRQQRRGKGNSFRMREGLMGILNRGLILRKIILKAKESDSNPMSEEL